MDRERLRSLLRADAPDDASVAYRAVTAGCVIVSVLAAVMQGAVGRSTGYLALLLVPIGSVYAYANRGRRNIGLKLILTVGLVISFGAFLNAVRGASNVDDTRTPLVAVFLWTQVLHSFDVPRARDLTFSVAASVALIALAGSLAFSSSFIFYVLIYAALLIAAMVLSYRNELARHDEDVVPSEEVAPPRRSERSAAPVARRFATTAIATVVATAIIFVFLPRVPAQQLQSLPFEFGDRNPIDGFDGDVALPSGASDVGSSEAFDPDFYFGYGETLNLRVRGQLSEDLVMRVRSPRPSLYRAQAYDVYENGRWTSSDDALEEISSDGSGSLYVPTPRDEMGPGEELIQTFYVERELPNLLFHAHRAQQLYVAQTRLWIDDYSSIRLPFTLEEDTIYSVVSYVPESDLETLRFAGPVSAANPEMQRFLQVPEALEGRFSDLAREITSPYPAAADKAEAVQAWLRENKEYRLDISRDPPNRDPVDVFVFDRDEGFCEQIAATMALMLRASGVPTRVVTGFGPGNRNLFTGYWEVRNSDAHAWVEVFYPGYGWVPYDPTFGVPLSNAANTTFMLQPLAKIASAVPTAARAVGRSVGSAADALPGPSWLLIPVVVAGVALALRFLLRRRPADRAPSLDASGRAAVRWLELEAALAARGYGRPPHETALEFAERLSPLRGQLGCDLRDLATRFGAFRYGDANGEALQAWDAEVGDAIRTVRAGSRRSRVGVG